MILYYFYTNYIYFDYLVKFNEKSVYLKVLGNEISLTLSSSGIQPDQQLKFIPLFFFFFNLIGLMPRPTFIKKAVASFKTIKNDLYGAKIKINGKMFFIFFYFFLTYISPFLKRIGYKQTFSFNKHGVCVFGLQNLKTLPIFNKSFLKFMSKDIGCDFSISSSQRTFKKSDIFSKKISICLVSAFTHLSVS